MIAAATAEGGVGVKAAIGAVVLALVLGGSSAAEPAGRGPEWIGSWQAAPASAQAGAGQPDKTIRNVVHTSIGGKAARVRLSNAFGTAPVLMGTVTVALSTGK